MKTSDENMHVDLQGVIAKSLGGTYQVKFSLDIIQENMLHVAYFVQIWKRKWKKNIICIYF